MDWGRFERQVVYAAAVDPMQMDVTPEGRIYFAERAGVIKSIAPNSNSAIEVGRLEVGLFGEVGLMGLATPHDYSERPGLYVMYCPQTKPSVIRVSRVPLRDDRLDLAAEQPLLEYPIDMDFAVHMGGGLAVSEAGDLFIGTGDNTIPIPELPLDERPGNEHLDARRTSGNSRDLRGAILRIRPDGRGGYTIPAGNLFADGKGGRPEIYAMGCRNPFRISYDDATGTLLWGDVGPNIAMDVPIGPEGYDEFNATRTAGNFGWPLFVGPNEAYRDYDFATGELGDAFDPAAPINDSRNNTGAVRLPPARPAIIWYPSEESQLFPELGAGGRSAMAGPVYRWNDSQDATIRLPERYDGAWFIHDWSRNWIKAVWLDGQGRPARIEPFMPNALFRKPIALKPAPDGSLLVLEFGDKWFDNRDAQITRIVYRRGNRPPKPSLTASSTVGKAPLTVELDASGSTDPDPDDTLSYAWSLDGGELKGETGYRLRLDLTERGAHSVGVVVTDTKGASAAAAVQVSVGNAPPVVELQAPLDGGFFDWGDPIKYKASVVDEEDGSTESHELPDASIVVRATYRQRRQLGDDAAIDPALATMRKSTCFSCHATNASGGGPAYLQVAQRYAGDSAAVDRLAEKIVSGGAGVWGAKAMPAHPHHTIDEARSMAQWVLGVASDRTQQVVTGQTSTFLAPEKPNHRGDAGVLVLEAEYTDLGVDGIPPATGVGAAVLHSRRKKPAFADRSSGMTSVDVFEGEGGMVGFFAPGGWACFRGMRPDLAPSVRVRGISLRPEPQRVELRADSPDGPVIAAVQLPAGSYAEVESPLQATGGLTDVYLVAPGGAGAEPVVAVNWVEFALGANQQRLAKVMVAPQSSDDPAQANRLRRWAELVASTLNQQDELAAIVAPDTDWPADQRVIAESRAVVLVRQAAEGKPIDEVPARLEQHVDLMRRLGVGVVFLHVAPADEPPSGETASLSGTDPSRSPTFGPAKSVEIVGWPRLQSELEPWLVYATEGAERAVAWSDAPADAGRRVHLAAPEDPSAMAAEPLRDAISRAVLWAAWRDERRAVATWLDPSTIAAAAPDGLAETKPKPPGQADYRQPVPGDGLLPPAASTGAAAVDDLFWFITGVCLACAGPIVAVMAGFVWAYRARDWGSGAHTITHHNGLEAAWSIAPAIVVAIVFYRGMTGYLDFRTEPVGAYEVRVRAQKWNWSFEYPNGYIDPDLHVPAGRPVRLLMTSADVIHSVYIPAFRLKMDCVPGRFSSAWFEAPEPTPPGHSHPLYCAEYCGVNHSGMLAHVVVHEQEEFDQWLAEAGDLTKRLPPLEAGKLLYERRGCQQCHSTDGTRRPGGGPSFRGAFGTESELTSGETVAVDENYLRESILNPMAKVRAGYRPVMPSFQGQLSESEVDALVAFIKSLGDPAEVTDP
ncbi:cytochrome c oxidase subunit II [Botrimarina sp.]|uniref:cytochrome c oxidase subunit II n=1 Tax=Botrimarina sp. TaxID=2795802 RepID=UPI0032EBAFB1